MLTTKARNQINDLFKDTSNRLYFRDTEVNDNSYEMENFTHWPELACVITCDNVDDDNDDLHYDETNVIFEKLMDIMYEYDLQFEWDDEVCASIIEKSFYSTL